MNASLERWLRDLAGGRDLLDARTADVDVPEPLIRWPDSVVGGRGALPAPHQHRLALDAALAAARDPQADEALRLRVAYHARWLLALARPDDADAQPRVSIVVPVRDRAALALEAVESALAQTHANTEVIVADDGSRDDLVARLAPFGDCVRRLALPGKGASHARNAGVAAASGELVHFLDSDDLLAPDTLERKLDALRARPNADLVFSAARLTGDVRWTARPDDTRVYLDPPTGRFSCATEDLLRASLDRYPFLTSSVLLPRWLAVAIPFDERLRSGADSRLFVQLGLRGVRAVGLLERLTTYRLQRDALSASSPEREESRCAVGLLNFLDLLRSPRHWRQVGYALPRLCRDGTDARGPWALSLCEEILCEIAALGHGDREGLSPRPVLRQCALSAEALRKRFPDATDDAFPVRFARVVDEALARAIVPGEGDRTWWIGDPAREMWRGALEVLAGG